MVENLPLPHYKVLWKARVAAPEVCCYHARIYAAARSGFVITVDRPLSVNTEVSLEVFVSFQGQPTCLSAKATVLYSRVDDAELGAVLEAQITEMSDQHRKIYDALLTGLSERGVRCAQG